MPGGRDERASGGACAPNFEVSPPAAAWVGEGDGSVAVSLSATANARGAGFSLDWSTAAGTAEEGSDYAAASGTLTFAAEDFAPPDYRASGDIAVAILDDAVGEAEEESFGVSFAAAAGSDGVRLSIASTTVWIRDDDAVALTLAAAPAALDESGGARAVTVTATLAGAAASELSVPLSFGGTAEETADYAVSGTRGVTIAAGATSGETELTVTPVDDAVEDDGETIEIGATLTGYAVTAATVRIEEPPPPTIVLSVADATLAESAGAVAVTMELANPRADSVYRQCGLRALSGAAVTATPGADFELAANEERLRSRGGWRAETTLTVVDDAVFEADETLVLEGWCAGSNALARPPHGELRATPLALTILAGDDAADDIGLSLSTSPAAITEGGGEAEVTVSGTLTGLSVAPEADVTAVLSVGGGAIDGLDYTLSGSRTLTVPAGDATLTAGAALRIAALPDDLEEGDEYVEFSVTQVTRGGAVETLAERAAVSLLIADAWRVPPAPAGLRVSPSASDPARSLSAAWEAPGASPSVRSHHVDYRLRGDPDWSRRTVPAGETATTLAGLKAGMEYEVRVSAENAAGEGRPTGIVAVFTEELPCAPGAPGVAPPADGGDTELAAAWDAAADCGATIDRYRVRYREDPAREQTAAEWREQAVSGLATTLRGLAAGTWHVVQARAESDAAGMSRWSPDGFGRTRGAPERVERPAASGGERSVRVDWDAPRDGGYPISDYDVWYRKSGETEWTTHAFECGGAGPCPTATTISGLEADAAHEVVVRAENSAGAGEWSPVASAKTLRRLAAAFASADYEVERGETVVIMVGLSPAPDREVSIPIATAPAAASFMVDERSKSLTFTARDSANADGETVTLAFGALPAGVVEGSPSTAMVVIAEAVPSNTAPAFAGNAAVRTVAENARAGDPAGAPVAAADAEGDALAYALSGAGAARFEVDASGQISVGAPARLNHEQAASHAVTLTASDAKDERGGADEAVDDSIEVTIEVADVNEPPGDVHAPLVSMDGDGTLRVAWRAPANQGPPITAYNVRYRARDEAGWTYPTVKGTKTSIAVRGLDPCGVYRAEVRARNDEGAGRWYYEGRNSPACPRVGMDGADITEGETATFTVTSSETAAGLVVNVGCSGSGADAAGHPFAGLGEAAATIDGASATREIGSALDAAEEPAGWITCEVGRGDGYIVGRPRSKTVAVADADGISYTLAVTEPSNGTVTGGGVNCGAAAANDVCSVNKEANGSVTLTATPDADSVQGNWGGACAGTGVTCVLIMDGHKTVSKYFPPREPTLTITRPSNGYVTGRAGNTTVINCGSDNRDDCEETVDRGTRVSLAAMPNTDYRLGDWGGACSGPGPTCVLTMDDHETVSKGFRMLTTRTVAYESATYEATEGGAAETITVTLSPAADGAVPVPIAVSGGTAERGDYTVSGLTDDNALPFAAGDASKTFTITANEDADTDDETVPLGFGALPSGVRAGRTSTLTIDDDDEPPPKPRVALALNPSSISENGGRSTVTASLPSGAREAFTVTVTESSSAVQLGTNTVLSFARHATSSTGSVVASGVDDSVHTGPRSVAISGALSSGAPVTAPTNAKLTVTDDESPPDCTGETKDLCVLPASPHGSTVGECKTETNGTCSYRCEAGEWKPTPDGNSCTRDPVCGSSEYTCTPGTLGNRSETPKEDGACANREADQCMAGEFDDKSDQGLVNGACGSAKHRCSGGNPANKTKTGPKYEWDCLGVDEAKLWQCDGIDGAKNWTCTAGTSEKQCSVPDPAADDDCSETITAATDALGCTWCEPCTGTNEVHDNDCNCVCEAGYHRHNGQCVENPICGALVCEDGNCDEWSDDDTGSCENPDHYRDIGDSDTRFKWQCANGGMTENCSGERPAAPDPVCAELTSETGPPTTTNACDVGAYSSPPTDTSTVLGVCVETKENGCADNNRLEEIGDIPAVHAACGSVVDVCDAGTRTEIDDSLTHAKWKCVGAAGAKKWKCHGVDGVWRWSCTSGDETDDTCSEPSGGMGGTDSCNMDVAGSDDACSIELPVCGEVDCADGDCDHWSDDDDTGSCANDEHYMDIDDSETQFKWQCTNGGITEPCSVEKRTPPECSASTVTWTAGTRTCEASLPETAHGVTVTATDSTIDSDNPRTGSATFACSEGQWGSATNAECGCGDECLCVVAGNEWMDAQPERERTCVGNDACLPDSHRHSCTTPADPNGGYSSCRYDRHRGGIYCASHRTETCEPYPAVSAHCHVELPPCEICCEFGQEEYCP